MKASTLPPRAPPIFHHHHDIEYSNDRYTVERPYVANDITVLTTDG